LALNCVGGETATHMTKLLEKGGTMVTFGGMSLKPVTISTSAAIFNDVTLRGFWMGEWYQSHSLEDRKKLINHLLGLVKDKKLNYTTEQHSFPDGFKTALESALNSSGRTSKVLLKFDNKKV